ncbi:MAG: hypothetical protein AAFN30_19385, partial [Actinomycetota bacterium]
MSKGPPEDRADPSGHPTPATGSDGPVEPVTPVRNLGGPGGTGPAAAAPSGFRHGMRALRYPHFRLFIIGALASNSGNWLQNLAVPFVLFELTGRSLWVGLAGFAQFIPTFLQGPHPVAEPTGGCGRRAGPAGSTEIA